MLTIGKVANEAQLSTNENISTALDLPIADCPDQGHSLTECPILGAMERTGGGALR